jgi:hypothetical protein
MLLVLVKKLCVEFLVDGIEYVKMFLYDHNNIIEYMHLMSELLNENYWVVVHVIGRSVTLLYHGFIIKL